MTTVRRDGNETPFARWIRNHPSLDSIKERLCVQDTDYWIHQYRAHSDQVGSRALDSILLIELKTFSADLPFAQRDTLCLVDQLLRGTDFHQVRSYRRLKGPRVGEKRIVRCFGVARLLLSGSDPEDSDSMLWNGLNIDSTILIQILRFERDPQCPTKRLEYRRHHLPSISQTQPRLFREAAE